MIHTDGTLTIANAPHRGQGTPGVPRDLPGKVVSTRERELEREIARLKRELERAR